MTAWKRYGWTLCGTVMLAGLLGCEMPTGSLGRSDDGPFSKVPREEPAEEPETVDGTDILPHTHFAAGRLHESQNHPGRAVEQYQQAIALKPDYVEAYNRLGCVLDQLTQFTEAQEVFKKAIQLAPDQAHLHNNLGFSYIRQGEWRQAEIALKKAIELKPDFPRAHVNLGMALAQQERFEDALTEFQVTLHPADAYYNIGLMYQSKRRPVEAARAFHAALKVNPNLIAAEKRLAKLPADAVQKAQSLGPLAAKPAPKPESAQTLSRNDHNPTTQPTACTSDMLDTLFKQALQDPRP